MGAHADLNRQGVPSAKGILMRIGLLCGLVLAIGLGSMRAGQNDSSRQRPSGVRKTLGTPDRTRVNINRWSSGVWNQGYCDVDISVPSIAGGYYPRGTGKTCIYESGLMWGAHYGVGGEIRIGGCQYGSNLSGGKIVGGLPESPDLPKNRVYRVRPDIPPGNTTADVSAELGDIDGTAQQIYDQYHKDWLEWPWQDGAPFTYGTDPITKKQRQAPSPYDPALDIPGVNGADQTVWYVANDMFYPAWIWGGSMGMEMHQTFWTYSRTGALGSIIFRRSILINKGTQVLDSLYFGLFVDPDIGDATDDLVGCDTTRSLSFAYNARDVDAGYAPLPPPAVGFDLFQGPVVPGSATDSAIFLGKRVYGKNNLPMTAAYVFANGSSYLRDPDGLASGIPQWYNYMRGLIGRSGLPYTDPNGVATPFPYAGDPEKHTGWLDPIPADKRFGLCSGPVRMAPGDTQEVVFAQIAAGADPGVDRLSAIGLMKFYDDQAQAAYNNFFQIPPPPPPPKVTVGALDGQIILSWGDDSAAVASTELSTPLGYAFEGYNVYQFPSSSSSLDQAKRLQTFDVINGVWKIQDVVYDPNQGIVTTKTVQFGNDSGIKRSSLLTTDPFNSDLPLVNGTKYYYAVTAYSYNPLPRIIPSTVESPPLILTVIPHSPNPGTRYAGKSGDTITIVSHVTLPGVTPCDGSVIPLVVDPTRLTGDTYAVGFDTAGQQVTWKLTDQTLGKVCLSNQTNQSGDVNYTYVDGIQVKVIGPPPGMKSWSVPAGTRRFSPVGGGLFGLEGFSTGTDPNALQDQNQGTIGMAVNFAFGGIGSILPIPGYHDVLLRLAAVDNVNLWDPNVTPADTNFSLSYRYVRLAQDPPAQPEFAPWIKNPTGSYAFQDYLHGVPFSAWDMSTNPPTRLAVGHLENNASGGMVDGRYWPGLTDVDNGDANGPREFCFIFAKKYTTTPDPSLAIPFQNSTTPLMWVMTCARRADLPWAAGDQFMINASHINWPGNTFAFTAPKNTAGGAALAKADVSRINVFPNPYYGVNPQETDKYNRFVTFSHLPQRAIIRIFNLAGIMVRKIDRLSSSQFEQWDLKNQEGLPVGSGLYIVHIDMPDLGTTKIIKVAIVQEQQILDRF